jgi:formate dehydrogenase subunit gamma
VSSPEQGGGETLVRFDAVERAVHWLTALLMLELIATGLVLYVPALSVRVGHRLFVENLHVYTGLALLAPLLIGLAGPWGRRLLDDLRRFDRWTKADFAWFRRSRRARFEAEVGKFNGGQKAEAALLGSGMVVMLGTGILMRWAPASWITWQQGATLVHDIGLFAIGIAVLGHLAFAMTRPQQLRAIVTGRIPAAWARSHAPAWASGSDLPGRAPSTILADQPPE